jgi:hypothetical protein
VLVEFVVSSMRLIVCYDTQTILLQDKQQKNYCVSCQELDSDVDKDNPGTLMHSPFPGKSKCTTMEYNEVFISRTNDTTGRTPKT